MPNRITILGVAVDAVTNAEAVAIAERLAGEQRGHFITTPNSEMLVAAHRDPDFKRILNEADLALPDSAGLLFAARWRGQRLPERVSGTDFVDELARLAVHHGYGIYLLGGTGDVAQRAAEALKKWHPGLLIVGAESGGHIERTKDGWDQDPQLLGRLWDAHPTILLVALGHGKQEHWINDNLLQLPSVRLAIGIGGAFDFIAGDVRRAPASWRKAGFEWLWRLFNQPWRIGRIWTAVVTFPWLVITSKK